MPDYELKHISEIISALQLIKEECEKHANCATCPFDIAGTCGITHMRPEKWNIASTYTWRAIQ